MSNETYLHFFNAIFPIVRRQFAIILCNYHKTSDTYTKYPVISSNYHIYDYVKVAYAYSIRVFFLFHWRTYSYNITH